MMEIKGWGICSIEKCESPVAVKRHGLCRSHYRQAASGRGPVQIEIKKHLPRPTETTKICPNCLTEKELDEYYRQTNGAIRSDCKVCMVEKAIAHKRKVRNNDQ